MSHGMLLFRERAMGTFLRNLPSKVDFAREVRHSAHGIVDIATVLFSFLSKYSIRITV